VWRVSKNRDMPNTVQLKAVHREVAGSDEDLVLQLLINVARQAIAFESSRSKVSLRTAFIG
jgi:hypothetical protein